MKNVNEVDTNLQSVVKKYLGETLGIHPVFVKWEDSESMPYAVRSEYSFGEIRLLDHKMVVISPKEEGVFSVAKVAKHFAWIEMHYKREGVFIARRLEAYNRKRLIEQKIPFIIPGNQLYLPSIGIDFRAHLRSVREKQPKLSPSAQVLLLANLLGRLPVGTLTASRIAGVLSSTKMTMSRATEELESQDLIEVKVEGREKQIHFKARDRELWEKASPVLRSPVLQRVFIESIKNPPGAVAGLSALSERTMIVAPLYKVRALGGKEWKMFQREVHPRIIPMGGADSGTVELEIWRYNPRLLSGDGAIDPLSLYLSLRDTQDERVEGALDKLLEELKW